MVICFLIQKLMGTCEFSQYERTCNDRRSVPFENVSSGNGLRV